MNTWTPAQRETINGVLFTSEWRNVKSPTMGTTRRFRYRMDGKIISMDAWYANRRAEQEDAWAAEDRAGA